jgi:hypothetical protein
VENKALLFFQVFFIVSNITVFFLIKSFGKDISELHCGRIWHEALTTTLAISFKIIVIS